LWGLKRDIEKGLGGQADFSEKGKDYEAQDKKTPVILLRIIALLYAGQS